MSIIGVRAREQAPGVADASFGDLVDLLQIRAERQSGSLAYCQLTRGERPEDAMTYGDLDRAARGAAARLRGVAAPGARVLLLLPAGREFLVCLFGCFYAGMVAVPAEMPRAGRPLERLRAIAQDASPSVAITTDATLRDRADLTGMLCDLGCRSISAAETGHAGAMSPVAGGSRALALLQYTSGSTADPKGVMVTHGNFLATLADLDKGWRHGPDSRMVSWLPVFHDMGLVYGVLQPLYNGFPCYLMSPASFLQRPMRWLRAIAQLRATHSAAPNFAYQLCCDMAKPEDLATLDLSSWKVALNGAEPVRDSVLAAFARIFAPCGFDADAFCPGYGLAEATLKVATKSRGTPLRRLRLDASALAQGRIESASGDAAAATVVGQGWSDIGARIEIVDPETRRQAAAGTVGEIWVASPSVSTGYWRRPAETEETFGACLADDGEGPFLRTGDLGFADGGDLFVTGRLKDLIIVEGRNHYPQDIEATVQSAHPALRPDHGAAFAVAGRDGERLVVVQELRRSHLTNLRCEDVIGSIRSMVSEVHGLRASSIMLVPPGSIPKTTSGKIRRSKCRAVYLAGTLCVVHADERSPHAVSLSLSTSERHHVVGI
ncbi:MAG TPA: fatty acyl-AMP ligase [Rhizomicrobium sp.]|nr:fatty acyl-AMP ligase [Rhizomicrobium sp.]